MSRRWVLGLLGAGLGVLAAGCAAPGSTSAPATSTRPATTTAAPTTLSFGAEIGWALPMCTTEFEIGQVAGPESQFGMVLEEPDFAGALKNIQSAQQTVDAITPTGVADLDNLSTALRKAVDGDAPQITTLLNAAIGGHPGGVVDQVTQIVAGIHPTENELFAAGETMPAVKDALSSASSCLPTP